jgi:hypothetical protein
MAEEPEVKDTSERGLLFLGSVAAWTNTSLTAKWRRGDGSLMVDMYLYDELQRRAARQYPEIAALSLIAIKHLHVWWVSEVSHCRTMRDFYGWTQDTLRLWEYRDPVEVWARKQERLEDEGRASA